jgi:hypothetical protein
MWAYNHHRLPDDDHSRRVIEAMIPVVAVIVRTVVRATDDDLTGEVGIAETQ